MNPNEVLSIVFTRFIVIDGLNEKDIIFQYRTAQK